MPSESAQIAKAVAGEMRGFRAEGVRRRRRRELFARAKQVSCERIVELLLVLKCGNQRQVSFGVCYPIGMQKRTARLH